MSSAVLLCGIAVVSVAVPMKLPGRLPLKLNGPEATTICPAAGAATVAVGFPPPTQEVVSAGLSGAHVPVTVIDPVGEVLPTFLITTIRVNAAFTCMAFAPVYGPGEVPSVADVMT